MSSNGSIAQNQPIRFLGDGKVEKVNKRFMFVQDTKNGRIHVSIEAALPNEPNCVDLRDLFAIGDDVILTAVKQPNFDGCSYSACSVIRKNGLKTVQGKVVELFDKYAYVDVPKYGRIFAPFSARTDGTKYWHGKNVTVGKIVTMKIFPQPEHNKCSYVAYAVYPDKHFNITNNNDEGTIVKSDRQPDKVEKKLGMIVLEATNHEEGLIYSQATGIISFSKSLLHSSKFEAGMFVYVSAIKKVSEKFEKCTWKANRIEVVGFLPFVKTDILQNRFNTSEDCVTVESHAIVCRVSQTTSSIWLWNDLLGRIFVNNHHYINDLHAMDVVFVRAQYTAAFEDVPWSAISVRPVYENADQIREEYGQLMVSDDDWKVLHVCEQNAGGFYGFMEHATRGQCFMAWTDLNEGETAPPKGSTCRVTVYQQSRDSRHKWRALLVTQCDSNTKEPIYEHPIYETTGELNVKIQDQILSQLMTKKIIIPSQTNGNVWTVPSATVNQTNNTKIVTQHQTSSSNTSIDSGRASSGLVNDSALPTPVEPPPGFTTNLPIGAERAAVLVNGDKAVNGNPVSRTSSVDPFFKTDDKITHLYSRPNDQQYFNLWDPLNTNTFCNPNTSSTWAPLPFNLTDSTNIDTRRKSIGVENTTPTSPTMGYGQQMKSMLLEENGRSNGHASFAEAIKSKGHDANDQYEQFLIDEINKRPHLLMKLLSTDEKAKQYILSILKQQPLESDSKFTAF